jgi:hypothetical protein
MECAEADESIGGRNHYSPYCHRDGIAHRYHQRIRPGGYPGKVVLRAKQQAPVQDKGILTLTLQNRASGWRITGWVWSDQ